MQTEIERDMRLMGVKNIGDSQEVIYDLDRKFTN